MAEKPLHKRKKPAPKKPKKGIKKLRQEIDAVDNAILKLLGQRFKIAEQIGSIKRAQGSAIRRPAREKQVIASRSRTAKKQGLNPELVKRLYRQIMDETAKVQQKK
jgi:chorismate mutase